MNACTFAFKQLRRKSKVLARGLEDRTTQVTLEGTPASKHLMKRAKQIKAF